jgi:hypothetical protein
LHWFVVALIACRPAATCPTCEAGEVCLLQVDEADPDVSVARCEPVPSECGSALDCDDNTCVLAAYALCEPGSVGGLCDMELAPELTCYAE